MCSRYISGSYALRTQLTPLLMHHKAVAQSPIYGRPFVPSIGLCSFCKHMKKLLQTSNVSTKNTDENPKQTSLLNYLCTNDGAFKDIKLAFDSNVRVVITIYHTVSRCLGSIIEFIH